jgi:hypothetical protein
VAAREEEEDEEDEEDAESWLTGDDARHSYRSTTQTSSGRISRPPRKNAPDSPTHAAVSRGRSGKGSAAAAAVSAAAAAEFPTGGLHGASRTPSASSITNGVWGGATGPLGGLTVKIPAPRDDGLFGEGHHHHDADAGVVDVDAVAGGMLLAGEPSQTPTAVAELYPGAVDPFGKHRPHPHAHPHAQQHHHHPLHHLHHLHHPQYPRASGSSTATSSAASSLSPGREHQLLEPAEADAEAAAAAAAGLYDDDAFSKLQALAGRAAPEWAEALNEALGALEGVAANGQPHEHEGLFPHPHHPHQHQQQHVAAMAAFHTTTTAVAATGAYHHVHAAGHGGARGGVSARHGSIGSLTDSQAGSSSATSSYLPSDSDGGNSSGSEAAAAPGHFLVDEDEEEDLLAPSAKRARLLAPPTAGTGGAAALTAAASKTAVGSTGGTGTETGTAPAVSVVVEEEDYGYFTTEEELDQMLLGMLSHGPSVGAVGDARPWGLDD